MLKDELLILLKPDVIRVRASKIVRGDNVTEFFDEEGGCVMVIDSENIDKILFPLREEYYDQEGNAYLVEPKGEK